MYLRKRLSARTPSFFAERRETAIRINSYYASFRCDFNGLALGLLGLALFPSEIEETILNISDEKKTPKYFWPKIKGPRISKATSVRISSSDI